MAKDKLGDMFNRCVVFQEMLKNDVESREYMNEQTLALFVETGEMIQETNWKTWKKPKKVNTPKLNEEIIDMWHFLINISLAAGLDSGDVHFMFVKKNDENIRRQEEGY